MTPVHRGFVDVRHGQAHFRYGGRGPVVVMLHESPRSSRQHIPSIEWLGEHFTVVAPDLPGCGDSTPLTGRRPGAADFAAALAETLTALGIERCALYGLHTGAVIALQFAADHPERTALTILDGLPLAVESPADAHPAHHLERVEPTLDGSHLARQWRKVLDAHRYQPWFDRSAATRLSLPLPDDLDLHEYATDLFMAGRHCSEAGTAWLREPPAASVGRLRSPAVLMAREDDVHYPCLDRLPQALPAACSIERIAPQLPAWRTRLLELLRRADLPRAPWTLPRPVPVAAGREQRRHYVDLVHGQLCVRSRGDGSAVPLLLLHDVPGGGSSLEPLAATLGSDRRTLVPDLPGLGASHPLPYPSLGSYAAALVEMLQALEVSTVDVFAAGLGACFAVALAAHHPALVRRVALDGLPMVRSRDRRLYARHYCPPLVPDRHGGYLLQAWQQLSDAEVSWPWYDRTAAAVRRHDPERTAAQLQADLVEVMQQLPSYGDAARAALEAAVREILHGVRQPVLLFEVAGDVRYAATRRAARHLPQARLLPRPAGVEARAASLRQFLA